MFWNICILSASVCDSQSDFLGGQTNFLEIHIKTTWHLLVWHICVTERTAAIVTANTVKILCSSGCWWKVRTRIKIWRTVWVCMTHFQLNGGPILIFVVYAIGAQRSGGRFQLWSRAGLGKSFLELYIGSQKTKVCILSCLQISGILFGSRCLFGLLL